MKNNAKTLILCLGAASLALGQTTTAPIYQMSILAGIPTPNALGDNGPPSFATVSGPQAVALDKNGNIFIADNNNSRIREISAATGMMTTYTSTGINSPVALAFDSKGNLWVSQTGNDGQILRIAPPAKAGADPTTTIIADGEAVAAAIGSDGDYAYNAWLNSPGQLTLDASDNVYIADSSNQRIRMIPNTNNCLNTPISTGNNIMTTSCKMITIAGAATISAVVTPQFGTSCGTNNTCSPVGTNTVGDGAPALLARLSAPYGVAVTPDGSTLYIADTSDQRIRKVDMLTGLISTIIGNCTQATAVASGTNVDSTANKGAPGVIPCPAGSFGTATASGITANVSSLGDGKPAINATVDTPKGLFLDSTKNILYWAESGGNRIRALNLNTGIVDTVIGGGTTTGDRGTTLNSGLLTSLELDSPFAVWVQNGLIYWVETGGDRVRVADPVAEYAKTLVRQPKSTGSGSPATNAYLGFATTFASTASPRVSVDNAGNVYVIEASTNKIRQVNSVGIINEWAGTGAAAATGKTNGDTGPAVVGQLNAPQALAFDGNGNGYIADTGINRIRMVTPAGIISTVVGRNSIASCSTASTKAGTCAIDKSNYVGDGGPPLSAVLSGPQGVAVDSQNNLIIADTGHNAIRYVNLSSNVITTIAGGVPAGIPGGPTDGRSGLGTAGYFDSTNARYGLLNAPRGVAVDSKGNIYMSIYTNPVARELIPSNSVTGTYGLITFYGSSSSSGTQPAIPTGTGLASVPARIRITSVNNTSVAVDPGGNIYFALANDNRVNVVSADHSKVYLVAGGGTNDSGLNYTSTNAVNLELPNVTGVAVDSNGVVYTADRTGLVKKLVCTKNCLPLK